MAKMIRLAAPDSIRLRKMSADQIGEAVLREADKALKTAPGKAIGINAVSLESFDRTNADWGVWAEWTRSCCDRRRLIPEFEEPVDRLTPGATRAGAVELDNALNVQKVLLGKTHTERAKRKK